MKIIIRTILISLSLYSFIFTSENKDLISFRLGLSLKVGEIIKNSMYLLGIKVPDRM